MNRFAKKFRVMGSLCVLLNLAALFLPITKRIQENYADITWNQINYIQSALAKCIPIFGDAAAELTPGQIVWILLLMVLPAILSLIAGIWGIVGNYVQKISSLMIFAVLVLYIGMTATIGNLWPEASVGQEYCRGIACMAVLIFSGFGAVMSLAALIATPGKIKEPESMAIPQVEEIKQQQVEAKYNIMMEEKQEERKEIVHGVLVGLTGIYAGAEIPLPDGEYILLGRGANNHLVFEGQQKVSRNHCRIKWDSRRQKYSIRDYSSSGSFVNGSEDCLPQNLDLDLEPGTTIAIGDETNTFCMK